MALKIYVLLRDAKWSVTEALDGEASSRHLFLGDALEAARRLAKMRSAEVEFIDASAWTPRLVDPEDTSDLETCTVEVVEELQRLAK
jgi:hypothetical protein